MDYQELIISVNSKYKNQEKRSGSKKKHSLTKLFLPTFPPLLPSLLHILPFRIACSFVNNSRHVPKKLKNRIGFRVRRALAVHPDFSKSFTTGRALIIYYSQTGNTEKVARAIGEGCERAGLKPTIKQIFEASDVELYDCDLLCVGTPVRHGLPPSPVMKFMSKRGTEYRNRNEVRLNTKKIPGKNALVLVTYSGPHIGVSEALPAGKYLRQELEHLGFNVLDQWYIVGEFHGWNEGSTQGKLGDIRGRPNAQDLSKIEEKTMNLIKCIKT
jgi:hypothetical protein